MELVGRSDKSIDNAWQQDDCCPAAPWKAPAMCLKGTGRENAQRSHGRTTDMSRIDSYDSSKSVVQIEYTLFGSYIPVTVVSFVKYGFATPPRPWPQDVFQEWDFMGRHSRLLSITTILCLRFALQQWRCNRCGWLGLGRSKTRQKLSILKLALWLKPLPSWAAAALELEQGGEIERIVGQACDT